MYITMLRRPNLPAVFAAFIIITHLAALSAAADVRLNAGGPNYTDSKGQQWLADTYYTGGGTYQKNVSISKTVDDPLYRTERNGAFAYHVPVPNGQVQVALHFAELSLSAKGRRVFNVFLEGQQVLTNFDIYAEAGKNAALVKSFTLNVADGFLDLTVAAVVNNPKISAIEIKTTTAVNQPPVVSAGQNQAITLPANSVNLAGTASDDGLPNPPGALTYAWTKSSGPGTVTFGAPTSLSTSASFSAAGSYVLVLTASDTVLSASSSVTVTVNAAAVNQPPVVSAGQNQTITLPTNSVNLAGTASDDGLPNPPGALTYAWTKSSGPGTVTFGAPTSLSTSASFSAAGSYILVLTASDSVLSAGSSVTVTVNQEPPVQQALRINAGGQAYTDTSGNIWSADTSYVGGDTYANASAIAATNDDPLYQSERYGTFSYQIPVSNGTYTVTLHFAEIYFSTAGSRVFSVSAENQTVISNLDIYAEAGQYTPLLKSFTVTVGDGALNLAFTSVIQNAKVSAIQVTSSGGTANQAPLVNAGADQAITLPANSVNLTGSATDDGLPNGTLSLSWSKTSGPGTVTFSNANSAATSVSFSSAGTYVLKLTASDGALSAFDETTIIVNSPSSVTALRINCGGGQYTDTSGNVWAADTGFVNGATYIRQAEIGGTADDVLYQSERYGTNFGYAIPVPSGQYQVVLHFAEIYFSSPGQRVFNVAVEGAAALNNLDIVSQAGALTALTKAVTATVLDGVLDINITGVTENGKISAIEVQQQPLDHLLHAVINAPSLVVDYDNTGSELVTLDGSGSHTHELGHVLVSYAWKDGTSALGSGPVIATPLALGLHPITLTVTDDVAKSVSDTAQVAIYPPNAVGGVLARYYPSGGQALGTFIDNLPSTPAFAERLSSAVVSQSSGNIGGSPYTGSAVVVLSGAFQLSAAGTYLFTINGQDPSRIYIDNSLHTGPVPLAAGNHQFEARIAVSTVNVLPRELLVSMNGGAAVSLPASTLTHNETQLPPVINSVQPSTASAGAVITLRGLGFFPANNVTVAWGPAVLSGNQLNVSPESIDFLAPQGSGVVPVSVVTPQGTSNTVYFTYTSGGPISFSTTTAASMPSQPTQAAWGPDGRLYVAAVDGYIYIYTFNDNYTVTNVQTVYTIGSLYNYNILGLAFNPYDTSGPVKLYVSHSRLYVNGGGCFSGSSPYTGQVSLLQGPSFGTATPVVTGLPVSNHDHGLNALEFDNDGNLLLAVGGATNAGVAACELGGLPESPFSGAILKIDMNNANLSGAVHYTLTSTGAVNDDQRFGEQVDPVAGLKVSVFASGLRNTFDIVLATNGLLYGPDNGQNTGYGPASTSAVTEVNLSADSPDELNIIASGNYYGHPNRGRGRYNGREYIYRAPDTASISGQYTAPIAIVPSSTNGIDEYRSMTFGGQMRGHLILQHWDQALYDVALSPSGTSIVNMTPISGGSSALDVIVGPGGVIFGIDYMQNAVTVSKPNDTQAPATAVYDIFPWRAPADGTAAFVIGGKGFGTLANTTVAIGGIPATLQSVSAARIRGTIPVKSAPTPALLDVAVVSNGVSMTIPQAFRYLQKP